MMDFRWSNEATKNQFELFHKLTKQGWRIELEDIDQLGNGYWQTDDVTGLPIPNQRLNSFGDVSLVTWSTYVYPPKAVDWVEDLNASFNSPLEAYEWLAPRLSKYAKECQREEK